ncbi:MAG: hypothetical protein PHG83_03215 [Patescibacteria group bacterium]|nr:hypothetical protein [Patescibacteria group bacterium]
MRDQNLDRMERIEGKFAEEEKVKEMEKFLKTIAEKLREEGVPVDDDCRINPNSFRKLCSKEEIEDMERDAKRINRYKSDPKWTPEEQKNKRDGEKLEMFKTAIFNKFLKDKFIVVRSSQKDDIDNGVDNVIIEKETGNIVSAFDEVATFNYDDNQNDPRYEKKANNVIGKNKNGVSIEYGFSVDKNKKIQLIKDIKNIPIFYLALPQKKLEEGIMNFKPDSISKCEENFFNFFIGNIIIQMKSLESRKDINLECQNKLKLFKESLVGILKEPLKTILEKEFSRNAPK